MVDCLWRNIKKYFTKNYRRKTIVHCQKVWLYNLTVLYYHTEHCPHVSFFLHPGLAYWDLTPPFILFPFSYGTPKDTIGWKKPLSSSPGWWKNENVLDSLGGIMVNRVFWEVPWPKTLGFWPWDLPRDSIHHDTPLAFPHIFPLPYLAAHWYFICIVMRGGIHDDT